MVLRVADDSSVWPVIIDRFIKSFAVLLFPLWLLRKGVYLTAARPPPSLGSITH